MREISLKIWFSVSLVAVLAVGIALVPVWYGYRHTGQDEVLASLGRDDEYVYLTWVRQSKQGRWLFNNPFTLEPHRRLYLNPVFLLMGKVAKVFSLAPLTVFNIFRVIGGVSLVIGVFIFWHYLITDRRWQLAALMMACFAGGLGYLSWSTRPAIIRNFNDLFMTSRASTEARFLPSILFYPQGPISVVLLLTLWLVFLKLREGFRLPWLLISLISGSLLVAIHPYNLVLVLAVGIALVAVDLPVKRDDLLALMILALSFAPVSLYFWYVIRSEPVYRAWTRESQLSPPLIQWLVLYAPVLPLSFLGFLAFLAGQRPAWLRRGAKLLVVWFALLPVLLYLPVRFQRRLAEGAYLPVTLMATLGIWWLNQRFRRRGLVLALVLVAFSLPDYPFQSYLRVRVLREDIWGGYYLPKKKVDAFAWIDHHLDEAEAVLAFPPDGLYLPAFSGNRVFLGHWANTINSSGKWDYLVRAFQPRSAPFARERLMRKNQIGYFLISKKLPPPIKEALVPWGDRWLSGVFENEQIAIFRAIPPATSSRRR